MIDKIKKYLIENIAYVIVFSFAGIYLVVKYGASYSINYISILLGLFIPAFAIIQLYELVKSIIFHEDITYRELLIFMILLGFIIVVYLFGLKESQRIALGLINGATSIILLGVMFFKTKHKR